MSKTCPLSTAVEFKACACALLDVFQRWSASEPSVIATIIARVPLANPGHGYLLQDVSTGWQRMPHRSVINPTEHRFLANLPISCLLRRLHDLPRSRQGHFKITNRDRCRAM